MVGCHIPIQQDVSILGEPVHAGSLTIPNSIAIQPMEGADGCSDGSPGPLTLRRYQRLAAGGAGLIWAEAIAITPQARANPHQLWLNNQNVDSFKRLVSLIRDSARQANGQDHTPIIVAQLTHSGRYSKPDGVARPIIPQRDPYRDPLTPECSPTTSRLARIPDDYPLISDDELDQLQKTYVHAARLAFQAGFDAIDIKACHGYLINELLAARNRPGKYGGSFNNRTRFLLEVIDRIHAELGPDKAISSRLNFYDAIPFPFGWGVDPDDYTQPDLAEPLQLVRLLHDRGVRLINFTIANPYYNPHFGRPFNQPIKGAYPQPEHPLKGVARMIDLAAAVQRQFPDIRFVGTGYSWLRTMLGHVGAAAKATGMISLVGGGRMALAYPDFPRDLLTKGQMDKNKVCVGCSGCTQLMRDGQMAGCVVRDNPIYGPIFKKGRQNDPVILKNQAEHCLQCQEPSCQLACPAGIDIPRFIQQFLDGDEKAAWQTIRQANILPEICAWLCPVEQQCQGHCLQHFIGDRALPIADIQRYLAEQANKNGWSKLSIPSQFTGQNVAIIGAGPAGLAAAAVLLEAGHRITLFDSHKQPGGLIDSVIPADRQYQTLNRELKAIFEGIPQDRLTWIWNYKLSPTNNLDGIMAQGFNAAFIALGLPQSICSSDQQYDGLVDALTFLNQARTQPFLDLTGQKIAVIGGGNTAMDAAVTASQRGASDVYLLYRRSYQEMPAWPAERDRAIHAGIHFIILTQSVDYLTEQGKIKGLAVCHCHLGSPDESGRRRSIAEPDNNYKIDCDMIIEAIGQRSPSQLDHMLPGVRIVNGLIDVSTETLETTRPMVFAGGDIVRGASTVVAAVADGMRAARELDARLALC